MSTYTSTTPYTRRKRRRRRPVKRFTRSMRIWLFILFCAFIVAFVGLEVRIYKINRDNGDRYRKQALSQQAYTNTQLDYQRGTIKDRNDTTMAVSIRKYNLVLESRTLRTDEEYYAATLDAISGHFGVSRELLEEQVKKNPDSMYLRIKELMELDSDRVEAFEEKMKENSNIQGVWFEETFKRTYPLKNVACNIIGFMSSENQGTYGVEESYNDVLCGVTGREYGYFDSDMKLQRTIKEARDGDSVILTIDANIQQLIEQEIQNFQKNDVGANRVAVMLMNPRNGEVLAMATDSTFDLNDPGKMDYMYTQEEQDAMTDEEKNECQSVMWSNFCIGSAYEPGSTYKPFTVAAALDENLVNDNSTFVCTGVKKVADREIHCSNRSGHGTLELRHSLMESCNSALMEIGGRMDRAQFSKYNRLYGFGQKTGIDLPGEASGLIHSEEELNPVELATSSFGQTQTMTMVQMLSGFCSLVNGGNYYQPHVVKEIQNSEGDVVESVNPVIVKKTTTEDTSRKLRSYLKSTVEEGTASPAKVKGYSIGGKTGTAEKRPVSEKNYLVSFIGCVPAEDPDVAVYVIIDEPHVKDQAHSTYATKFAHKILKKVLPFLGQYPSKES